MSEFFRHCPQCGKRFHIKLVSKGLVGTRLTREAGRSPAMVGSYGPGPVQVMEGAPITVEVEDFQYAYRCGHCGHQWQEIRTEDYKAG